MGILNNKQVIGISRLLIEEKTFDTRSSTSKFFLKKMTNYSLVQHDQNYVDRS